MQKQNIYVAIDLKSFYASVECRERGLNPLTTNLVVADSSRTEKTICLAVSPSLKQYGIPGRARLFEVVQKVREINTNRRYNAPGHILKGKSYEDIELKKHPEYELDYIIAPPQMKKYMKYSTNIYNVYLKYFSPDDICVYSIDEVFIDVTHYLKTYQMKASQLATKVIHDIYKQTGITATCGVGTNLYLAKIAMDIVAKHAHGTINLDHKTSSNKLIGESVMKLYNRIIDKRLLTRRINITANNVISEEQAEKENKFEQIDLFTDYSEVERKKEQNLQRSILDIKKKYGKNAILKGMNFEDGGTTIERSEQVGGHKG